MQKAKLSKNWTVTPNVRLRPYVSLAATMGWYFYRNKTALLSAGWTLKFSCDGVTGPTNSSDTTDRITSDASAVVRAAVAAAAQSWFVVQNADGVQMLFTYQGASDDIARLSVSYGGLFTLAGTTTQQPTATDELLITTASSVIHSGTSDDRVAQIWCTNESWSCAVFRLGSMIVHGAEKFDSAVESGQVLSKPYCVYRYGNSNTIRTRLAGSVVGGTSLTNHGSANWTGAAIRVFTGGSARVNRISGGDLAIPNGAGNDAVIEASSGVTNTAGTALQGNQGMPLVPIHWWGERLANLDGLAGSPIDWWQTCAPPINGSVPAIGDMFPALDVTDDASDTTGGDPYRTHWLVSLGGAMIRPWKNAAPNMETL